MRIAIVTRDFPPTVGGIGDHTDHLAHELAARGHDVVVLCCAPGESRTKVEVRPVIPAFDAASIPAIDRALADASPDAILWQYNPFTIGRRGVGPSAGRIAKAMAKHAPLVLVAHELWFPWGREGVRGLVWAVAQRLETAAVVRASKRLVVTTESRAATVRAWFRSRRDEIALIPIGSNFEPDATREPGDIRARLGATERSLLIAHLGSMGAGRDFGPAFEAVRALRAEGTDVRVVCVGKTGGEFVPAGLESAVIHTGVLSAEVVSLVLRASDAYLFCERPGPAAGRKTGLQAAFAHGLPVVAYAGPDRDSSLRAGENVMLVEPRSDAVARALRALARDPALRTRIGAAARRLYEEKFAWPVAGRAFDGVLEGL